MIVILIFGGFILALYISILRDNSNSSSKDISGELLDAIKRDFIVKGYQITSTIDVVYPTVEYGHLMHKCILLDTRKRVMRYCSVPCGNDNPPVVRDFSFSKIIGSEFSYIDGQTGSVFRATVGYVLAGGVGAIVGALTKSKKVRDMKCTLYLNTPDDPYFIIKICDEVSSNASIYFSYVEFGNRIMATIKAIVDQNSFR